MAEQIKLVIEKMNRGHWLRVNIPYTTNTIMTATLQNQIGETLKRVRLVSGHNFIDIESIPKQSIRLKIDTPFETFSKELLLD